MALERIVAEREPPQDDRLRLALVASARGLRRRDAHRDRALEQPARLVGLVLDRADAREVAQQVAEQRRLRQRRRALGELHAALQHRTGLRRPAELAQPEAEIV